MIFIGDALTVLRGMRAKTFHCVVTSPPYYGLRDYGVAGQIGLEPEPRLYVERLVEIFREVRRVLRDDGTLWLNLGDSYFGSGKGAASAPENAAHYKQGTNKGMVGAASTLIAPTGPAKNLMGIPWRVAFALQEDGWNLRQDIIWAKPNPMPESVTDRCTKAHEYIFLFSKSRKYYFDAEAIREPVQETTVKRCSQSGSTRTLPRYGGKKYTAYPEQFFRTKSGTAYDIRDGRRNKRDVWTVPTVPCKEAHFATFPPELIRPCIRAGAPIDGIVLDPFFGSGTTGVVCTQENRNYIGIELNRDYVQIAKRRIEAVERTGRLMI